MNLCKRLLVIAVLSLALFACSQDEETGSVEPTTTRLALPPQDATDEVTVEETAVPTPSATPRPTSTPSSEVGVAIEDQILDESGELTAKSVAAESRGWLVIRADDGGQAGEVLGYTQVPAGESENVVVTIDPFWADETGTMYAVLHVDQGQLGEFEFPGPDAPEQSGSDPIAELFSVDRQVALPTVVADDQEVAEDGLVTVAKVVAPGPGYVALHSAEEDEIGRMLAYAPVKTGLNENLVLAINWRQATPTLYAVLYEDAGEPHVFESHGADRPITFQNEPMATTFRVSMPPIVFVINQPVVDDSVVVERAVAYGPAWLVIFSDDEGGLDTAIGWAPLQEGINEQILVPLLGSPTQLLHIMIHEDTDDIGEFEFPRADPPLIYQDRVPNPITFRTDPGNYLVVHDQPLGDDGTLNISLVVTTSPVWVVVQAEEEGDPGDVLGRELVPAGVNRDVGVEIEDGPTGGRQLLATMHWDSGQRAIFEYPDGPDIPMTQDDNSIRVPFSLLTNGDE